MIEDVVAPLLIAMQNNLGVGFGPEYMPKRLELFPQFSKIVDLPIKHNPNRLFSIRHGLMPTCKINDGEPAEAQPNRSFDVIPLIIGAAMSKRLRHVLHLLTKNRSLGFEIVLPADSTHTLTHFYRTLKCTGVVTH